MDLAGRPGGAWVFGEGRRDGEATGEGGPDLVASSWDGARSEEEEGLGVVSPTKRRRGEDPDDDEEAAAEDA